MVLHFYLKKTPFFEFCYNVEVTSPLTDNELTTLKYILADGFIIESVFLSSAFNKDSKIVELGPRMNFATAFSTNIVSICKTCGLDKVVRIERSRRYLLDEKADREDFI
ncbi:MAG TPA: hypothetical protein PK800_07995, partial [Syntrophorhabdaceae bacterium]|nr:hypothetical protein [Syntrophorhabdaceae bacterium]